MPTICMPSVRELIFNGVNANFTDVLTQITQNTLVNWLIRKLVNWKRKTCCAVVFRIINFRI